MNKTMHFKAVVSLVALFMFSGCGVKYTLTEDKPVTFYDLSIKAPEGWSAFQNKEQFFWTYDGLSLNEISGRLIKPKDYILARQSVLAAYSGRLDQKLKPNFTYDDIHSTDKVAEMYLDSLGAIGLGNLTVINQQNEKVNGLPAVRLDYVFDLPSSLRYQASSMLIKAKTGIYLVSAISPQEHYFSANNGLYEQALASISIIE